MNRETIKQIAWIFQGNSQNQEGSIQMTEVGKH